MRSHAASVIFHLDKFFYCVEDICVKIDAVPEISRRVENEVVAFFERILYVQASVSGRAGRDDDR